MTNKITHRIYNIVHIEVKIHKLPTFAFNNFFFIVQALVIQLNQCGGECRVINKIPY